jgi:hypothetical protein
MRGREVKKLLRHPLIHALVVASTPVYALQAISEREMAGISGQAFISVDASNFSSNSQYWEDQGYSSGVASELSGDYEFSKISLGLEIETLFNAESLVLGEFERPLYLNSDGTVNDINGAVPATRNASNPDTTGEVEDDQIGRAYDDDGDGLLDTLPADIMINDFALGRVLNSDDADNATVDPFRIVDPYIELAYKVENGQRRAAGVRLGLGESQGWLSGEILSLTGTFEGQISGPVQVVYDNTCPGNDQCFLLFFATGVEIVSQIDLVDGARDTEAANKGFEDTRVGYWPGYGYGAGTESNETYDSAADGEEYDYTYPYADTPYLKRASWAGVPAGRNFEASDTGLIAGLIPGLTNSHECIVSGTPGCFSLTKYQSIYVGVEGLGFDEGGAAKGAFVSLQSEAVPWEDLSGIAENAGGRIPTQLGAYLHLARFDSNGSTTYPLLLDLYDATVGTQRVATCVGQLKGC